MFLLCLLLNIHVTMTAGVRVIDVTAEEDSLTQRGTPESLAHHPVLPSADSIPDFLLVFLLVL